MLHLCPQSCLILYTKASLWQTLPLLSDWISPKKFLEKLGFFQWPLLRQKEGQKTAAGGVEGGWGGAGAVLQSLHAEFRNFGWPSNGGWKLALSIKSDNQTGLNLHGEQWHTRSDCLPLTFTLSAQDRHYNTLTLRVTSD